MIVNLYDTILCDHPVIVWELSVRFVDLGSGTPLFVATSALVVPHDCPVPFQDWHRDASRTRGHLQAPLSAFHLSFSISPGPMLAKVGSRLYFDASNDP